jgi:hypothetical protein
METIIKRIKIMRIMEMIFRMNLEIILNIIHKTIQKIQKCINMNLKIKLLKNQLNLN